MLLSTLQVLSLLFWSSIATKSGSEVLTSNNWPNLDAARRNAFHIFNTVHSAMRQWGSSLNHNGLSLFLATVPQGNLFYHGGPSPSRPNGFEWLAFEVEHGYAFAVPFLSKEIQMLYTHKSHFIKDLNNQHSFFAATKSDVKNGDDGGKPKISSVDSDRFYFHTYRAERPLKLIYIDGMSAAKGAWGTYDLQDLLVEGLDGNSTKNPKFDPYYAQLLCKLATEWGIDGWVRMESGFEIIYCDFAPGAGLEFMSHRGSDFSNNSTRRRWERHIAKVEWLRAASQKYHGMSSERIQVDWSSMVSAFTYDVNITNPDPDRQDLPRLVEMSKEQKETVRTRLHEVVAARKDEAKPNVDWQNVVDQIITRFSDRLYVITHGNLSVYSFWGEVNSLVGPFLDYPMDKNVSTTLPVTRCTRHYLDTAIKKKDTWTPEDAAIHVAVETVTNTICSSLFQIRSFLGSIESGADDEESALLKSREVASVLMDQLKWTTWKECGGCASPGQFCLIPMFPVGSLEDYYSPKCKGLDDLEESFKSCYWLKGFDMPC